VPPIVTQTLYLDGAAVGSLSGTVSNTGLQDSYVGAGYLGGSWPAEPYYSTSSSTGTAMRRRRVPITGLSHRGPTGGGAPGCSRSRRPCGWLRAGRDPDLVIPASP
jgi:hypothetical protein